MKSATSIFDHSAASFDLYRAFPPGVPETIRASIWKSMRNQGLRRVLDVGAGTGRIGKAFVEAGDSYAGIDVSGAMLQEFRKHSTAAILIQADGACLPFSTQAFDLVMLMQVLSGVENWRALLNEVRRVLRPGGTVVVGHTTNPSEGVDARLKRQLGIILEEMSVEWHEPNRASRQSIAWLESAATRTAHVTAANWVAERTSRDFLIRHRTGARFNALPPVVQEEALQKLSVWTEENFGPLDANYREEFGFNLDIFEFELKA
jgi:ubiquinone/menaquinone biosynthesis C-methylase UbiE